MRKLGIISSFVILLIVAGCSGSGTREELDQVLNETFDAEEEYRDVQDDLEEREKKEQQLFEEIMALTQEQQEDVEKQAQEAIDSADERLDFLQTEKESMQAAEENFAEIDGVIEEAEEAAVKTDLEALKAKMDERFAAHDEFTQAYEGLIGLQKELYEMLKDEENNLQMLQEKATEVNEQNEQVQNAVTAFNDLTQQVNELKDATMEKLNENEE